MTGSSGLYVFTDADAWSWRARATVRIGSLVVVAAAGLALAGTAQASDGGAPRAKPGTFAGSVGVKVPKGAHANVRAIDRASAVVASAKTVGRSGKFSLSLAPGSYLVVGTVVTAQRKLVQKRIAVSLKPGQKRKRASLAAPKRKRGRKHGRRAQAAFVQELGQVTPGRIAVEIPDVQGRTGNPDWDAFIPGINDYVTTDVIQETQDCGAAVIEVDRRAELIKELEFQQSPYVDPSTRVTRNLILGDVEIRGTITGSPGDTGHVTMTIVEKATGKTLGTRETTIGRNDWPDQLDQLAKDLADDVCKLSDVYTVTLNVSGEGRFATHSTSGVIAATLRARRQEPGKQLWRDAGPLQWGNVGFVSNTDCAYIDPVIPAINWSVTILDAGDGQLQVTWLTDGNDSPTASVDCPGDPDPPPVPGQPGPALVNTGPQSFLVPYGGGTQQLSGIVADGGDGFFNSGTITVERGGIG